MSYFAKLGETGDKFYFGAESKLFMNVFFLLLISFRDAAVEDASIPHLHSPNSSLRRNTNRGKKLFNKCSLA